MSNNTAALKAKISKLGKEAFEKKMASKKFTAEELPIALEIQKQRQAKTKTTQPAPKKDAVSPKAKADKAPVKDKKATPVKDKAVPTKSAKKETDAEKNYGKSDFVRAQIASGVRSHKDIAALVLAKFATKLYYSEYDRCRKQVDQRPADKK